MPQLMVQGSRIAESQLTQHNPEPEARFHWSTDPFRTVSSTQLLKYSPENNIFIRYSSMSTATARLDERDLPKPIKTNIKNIQHFYFPFIFIYIYIFLLK